MSRCKDEGPLAAPTPRCVSYFTDILIPLSPGVVSGKQERKKKKRFNSYMYANIRGAKWDILENFTVYLLNNDTSYEIIPKY